MTGTNHQTKFIPQFPGQREDEEIVTVLYRHWYVVAAPAVKSLVIILLSFAIPLWLHLAGLIFSYAISTIIYYLWIVFWISYIVYAYLNWSRDRFIITDQRIIDIDQKGLFRQRVSEVELEQIRSITHETVGFFSTVLKFGTVFVHAGEGGLTLNQVPNPANVKEDIIRLTKRTSPEIL